MHPHRATATPACTRRPLRRLRRLLVAAGVLSVGGIGVVAGAPPAAAQTPEADVRLTSISSVAPEPGNTVTATGTVTNTGDVDLHEVTAAFWVDPTPLRTRGEVARAAAERPGTRLATRITEPYSLIDQVHALLEPGERARFELEIPVEQLELSAAGVYLVGVDVSATIPPVGDRDAVGRVRTFLPWVPSDVSTAQVEIATVVPLVAEPAIVDSSTVLDQAAARAFAPDGRLSRLLELGSEYDVTWLVDPAVLELASIVASGYRYADGSGPVDGTAAADARAWLARAEEVLDESNTLLLPYADPDLSALTHHDLLDQVGTAVTTAVDQADDLGLSGRLPELDESQSPFEPDPSEASEDTTGPVLPPERNGDAPDGEEDPAADDGSDSADASPTETEEEPAPADGETEDNEPADEDDDRPSAVVSWPDSGFADAATLETLAANDMGGVIVSQSALPEVPRDGTTPVVSLSTPSGPLTALVTDPTLTAGGPPGGRSSVLVRQRMLSETLLLALRDQPASGSRRVAAVLPRRWGPNDAAVTSLLDTPAETSWLQPSSAVDMLAEPPTAYGGPLDYPNEVRDRELGSSSIAALSSFALQTSDYLTMLPEPDAKRTQLDRDFLRGASTAWRDKPERGAALLRIALGQLDDTKNNVSLVSPRFVTLSSRSGSFPVTVANENDFPVRVGVNVRTRAPGLLDVSPLEPLTIPPNRRETAPIAAEVRTGGVVQVEVALSTPEGTTFGEREDFAVRSTEYGLVGWAVLGVGVGLLALAAALRIVRLVRGPRATDPVETDRTP